MPQQEWAEKQPGPATVTDPVVQAGTQPQARVFPTRVSWRESRAVLLTPSPPAVSCAALPTKLRAQGPAGKHEVDRAFLLMIDSKGAEELKHDLVCSQISDPDDPQQLWC